MKFTIYTFGCKVNQYESNMMKEQMLSSNFLYTPNFPEADIYCYEHRGSKMFKIYPENAKKIS